MGCSHNTTEQSCYELPCRSYLRRVCPPLLFFDCVSPDAEYKSYPLFGFTPVSSGGLGLTEAGIGVHLSLRALFAIIATLPYGYFQRYFGSTKLYQYSMPLWIVTILFLPLLNWLARLGWNDPEEKARVMLFDSALFFFFTAWSFAFFTSSMSSLLKWILMIDPYVAVASSAMIMDAAPSQEALATINVRSIISFQKSIT